MKSFSEYIKEAIDFRLGGSRNKGESDKTFEELKEGDAFYYAMYDKREGRDNEVFCIRQYKLGRKEKWNDKTKFFFIERGAVASYFAVPNKYLDSTLFMGETDMSKQITSTDKDEFFEELNKATGGSWSEKDLRKIE